MHLFFYRLRQIRVKNDSCQVHPDFQNAIKQCYGPYSESNEDMEPFGTGFRLVWIIRIFIPNHKRHH